ncbi:MAG: DUF1573 domain-containing protein [Bacteroidales bacterium]|nr:DUF1573 domain-containing protein [Bacteroidales bacterium]
MKRLLPILLVVVAVFCSCSRAKYLQKHATKAHIEFNTGVHDFGKVIFGEPAKFDFVFKNTGLDTLLITEVQSTCGCTIPKWSNKPVAPGEKGLIEVSYDTRRSGEFEKGITVFSNADNSAMLLVIKGFVTPNPHKEILGRNKTNTNDTISVNQSEKVIEK